MCNEQENPLVSIVIPTYKRPDMLGRAIDSVLKQTYDNLEIIVVDDNDEDSEYRKETEEFMEKYADIDNLVYLKHKKNKNGAAARNTGIKNAKGKYVSFLDDDDEYFPNLILKKINKIKSLGEPWGGVYSGVLLKNNNRKISILPKLDGNLSKKLLLKEFEFGTGSNLFIKTKIIEELNGFDESFSRHQDWEFLIRFFRKNKIAYVDELLIIKYIEDTINKPSPDDFLNVKIKFLNKFKVDISRFNKGIQKLIYQRHWLRISREFFKNKQFKKGLYYLRKSNKYKKNKIIVYLKILKDILTFKI